MITQLFLKNIQRFRSLLLDFVPGINIIVGETNVGKTTVLRAIQWVAENNLPTTVMKRRGSIKDVSCTIFYEKGIQVKRLWDEGGNSYITYSDGMFLQFPAVGRTVPENVKKLLKLKHINFQKTNEPSFLIGLSPEQRFDYIMKAFGLEEIMEIVNIIDEKIRKESVEYLKPLKFSIEQYKEKIKGVSIHLLEKKMECLNNILSKEDIKNNLKREREEIIALCSPFETLTKKVYNPVWKKYFETVLTLIKILNKIEEMQKEKYQLVSITQMHEKLIYEESDAMYKVILSEERLKDYIENLNLCPTCKQPLTSQTKEELCVS